jgi:hypothetical protein
MPSNHNMCIKNIKSNLAYAFTDNQWNMVRRDSLIDDLIRHKTKILNNKFNELEENNKTTKFLEDAHAHFNSQMKQNDNEGKDNLTDDNIFLLYNQRIKIEKLESVMKQNNLSDLIT